MSARTTESGRLESTLAGVLNFGTWLASAVIASGLLLPLFATPVASRLGSQVVTVGIALFILLPILRVILMLVLFLKERDYRLAAAAALVLAIILAGFVVRAPSK
ncbi:MAG TPA: DUF1634 domain-containing protein [Blastocatellia bacterium]|nr:DUF1634 domain-containing protein [Blastocatellia bacterium]